MKVAAFVLLSLLSHFSVAVGVYKGEEGGQIKLEEGKEEEEGGVLYPYAWVTGRWVQVGGAVGRRLLCPGNGLGKQRGKRRGKFGGGGGATLRRSRMWKKSE